MKKIVRRLSISIKYHLGGGGGDRRVRIFSADNNWWATPEVSLSLPYQRSPKVFLNFFAKNLEIL